MRKKRILLIALIVAAGVGWIISVRRQAEPDAAKTVVPERAVGDQKLVDAVLESPEMLDGENAERRRKPTGEGSSTPAELPTGKDRHLLSDVEKPPAPQPLKEPVAASSLHFHKDYASLRTDAVRNPDSAQNRAGVVSLMEARQRRLGQSK